METPGLDDLARLLKSPPASNVTARAGRVAVTMSPRYQLLDVQIDIPGMDSAQRTALQDDVIKAVNAAVQDVVIAAASALKELPTGIDLGELRAALQREVERSGCR